MQEPSTNNPKSELAATDQAPKGQVVAVLTDLMFDSRLRSTAQAQGLAYQSVRSLKELERSLGSCSRAMVIVDMEVNATSAADAIAQSASHSPKPTVIAYYPHVQTNLHHQAVEAGADLVLPRSRFSTEITGILAAHANPDNKESVRTCS